MLLLVIFIGLLSTANKYIQTVEKEDQANEAAAASKELSFKIRCRYFNPESDGSFTSDSWTGSYPWVGKRVPKTALIDFTVKEAWDFALPRLIEAASSKLPEFVVLRQMLGATTALPRPYESDGSDGAVDHEVLDSSNSVRSWLEAATGQLGLQIPDVLCVLRRPNQGSLKDGAETPPPDGEAYLQVPPSRRPPA